MTLNGMSKVSGRPSGVPKGSVGLYETEGADVYHDIAVNDTNELQQLVRAVRRHSGPVLDLASGSGRITFPLLATGRSVAALDSSRKLLDLLEERLATAPERIRSLGRTVHADMSAFDLGKKFDSVILGTSSISLLDAEGRRGLYRCVAQHLNPGGRFVLTTVVPRDQRAPQETREIPLTGASGRSYLLHEEYPDQLTRVITITTEPETDDRALTFASVVQVLSAEVLGDELAATGFRVVRSEEISGPEDAPHRTTLLEAEVEGS